MATTFLLRRGTAIDWATKNPLLRDGEMGLESNSGKYKIGDGYQRWNDLPYFTNEAVIKQYVDAQIAILAGQVSGVTEAELTAHVDEAITPHPNYDDGRDLTLLYENAKV